jgi:transcriptional regulator with XRE-family HTH domain
MKFRDLHHDEAALAELGRRLAQLRINMNMTQAELAKKAGVGKRTLERLEAGETTQTRTLMRVLRELDLLAQLEALIPEPSVRPRHIIKEGGALPKRATKKKLEQRSDEKWKWGDEK